jgi:hypothetical protein
MDDPVASTRDQLETLAVQASRLAAGSLEPDVVRRLTRRPALARRYLAVEGHRALAAIEDLLPPSVRSLIDSNVAARADSPAASLAAALRLEAIAEPPDSFGAIRARHLLASISRADGLATTRQHVPREQRNHVLAELAEDEDGTAADLLSSPVGGGGALGRLLGQLLGVARQLNGGGPPGADAPTHQTRAGTRTGGTAVFSSGMAGTVEEAAIESRGTKYPEWDVLAGRTGFGRGARDVERLLVVLSDGLAFDHGYEPVYGAADARRALAEARRRGTGCLCLSIGASTNAYTLRRVFGSAAHATIPRTEQLSHVIGPPVGSPLRGGSEVLEHALVPGVVGYDQAERGCDLAAHSDPKGLREVASTRVLIAAGRLVAEGLSPREAARAAVAGPLTDDSTVTRGLVEMINVYLADNPS